jgi:hypothetical protein
VLICVIFGPRDNHQFCITQLQDFWTAGGWIGPPRLLVRTTCGSCVLTLATQAWMGAAIDLCSACRDAAYLVIILCAALVSHLVNLRYEAAESAGSSLPHAKARIPLPSLRGAAPGVPSSHPFTGSEWWGIGSVGLPQPPPPSFLAHRLFCLCRTRWRHRSLGHYASYRPRRWPRCSRYLRNWCRRGPSRAVSVGCNVLTSASLRGCVPWGNGSSGWSASSSLSLSVRGCIV